MRRYTVLLFILFVLTLALRLHFAFSTPAYSSDEAYLTLRQVEHITATGLPLFRDELSYGGRTFIFNPLYYYILSLFNLFLPISIVGKVLPNIFISSIIFVVYFILHDTTKSQKVAFFGSAVATVIPVFYLETLNDISAYSLVIPVMLWVIYTFIKLRSDERYGLTCAFALAALSLLHPSSLVLVFAFGVYYIFLKVEGLSCSRAEHEVLIFGTFFIIFTQFFIYRKALFLHGLSLVWQNIPMQLLSHYFKDITLVQIIYQIGIIPVLYSVYIIYRYLFREKDFTINFYIAFAFAVSTLLYFKLIPIAPGLLFLGAILLLLFAQRFKLVIDYIRNSKFARWENMILLVLLASFLLTSLIPAVAIGQSTAKRSFSDDELQVFRWMREHLEEDATVLATPSEGHLITFLAGKKNVMDTAYLLINNINQRSKDIETIYSSFSETEALKALAKYDVGYIVQSEKAMRAYGINRGGIFSRNCLDIVFKNEKAKIFKVVCEVEEV